MVNASAGLTFANGIQLNLWGRNLTGDEYLLSAFRRLPRRAAWWLPQPAPNHGLTLKYNFE